jgi:hypothetical protein
MAPDIYQLLLDISLNYYCVTCGALWPPLCQCMVTLYWHSDVLLHAFCNLLLSVHTIGCIQAASSLNTYVTYHQIVFYDSCSRNRRDPEIGHCMLSKWHMHMQRWLGCHATSPTTQSCLPTTRLFEQASSWTVEQQLGVHDFKNKNKCLWIRHFFFWGMSFVLNLTNTLSNTTAVHFLIYMSHLNIVIRQALLPLKKMIIDTRDQLHMGPSWGCQMYENDIFIYGYVNSFCQVCHL